MGLILSDGKYVNFKSVLKKRVDQQIFYKDAKDVEHYLFMQDRLIFEVEVNIFDSIEKNNSITKKVGIYIPYIEKITDSDIYRLLKTKKITLRDAFGNDVVIDLALASDDVDVDDADFINAERGISKNDFLENLKEEVCNISKLYQDTPKKISQIDESTGEIVMVDNPEYIEWINKIDEVINKYNGYCGDVDNATTIPQIQSVKYVFTYN